MTVGIPVQSPAGEIEDAIERLARRGVGVEHQDPGKAWCRYPWVTGETGRKVDAARRKGRSARSTRGGQHEVPVARQNAYVVGVLVERVLPAALAYGPDERQLAGMHVGVGVIGLVRILAREVRVHQVRHRAPVDQEVGGVIGLGLYVEAASHGS